MKTISTPQGPWFNPHIDERVYDATIERVDHGRYNKNKDQFIQFVFWLQQPERRFVTNFYFPSEKPDNKSVRRLAMLCRCVGQVPIDAQENPQWFEGAKLQITVKKMKGVPATGGNPYYDADLFLPAGTANTDINDEA